MKIVYNNDNAIIDFLADLKCRRVVRALEKFVHEANNSGCLLYNCPEDDMVVLILHKDPFGFNDEGNTMVLYAETSVRQMAAYFKNQLDHTSPDAGDIYKAIDDITRLLFWRWASMEEENTQTDYMG